MPIEKPEATLGPLIWRYEITCSEVWILYRSSHYIKDNCLAKKVEKCTCQVRFSDTMARNDTLSLCVLAAKNTSKNTSKRGEEYFPSFVPLIFAHRQFRWYFWSNPMTACSVSQVQTGPILVTHTVVCRFGRPFISAHETTGIMS